MTGITTHVLDTSTGRPAAGVAVLLETRGPDGWERLATGETDSDGRCPALHPDRPDTGTYRLTFATGPWFASRGRECFHPVVEITFDVTDDRHHHVPLLVAPFGFSTYRGS